MSIGAETIITALRNAAETLSDDCQSPSNCCIGHIKCSGDNKPKLCSYHNVVKARMQPSVKPASASGSDWGIKVLT